MKSNNSLWAIQLLNMVRQTLIDGRNTLISYKGRLISIPTKSLCLPKVCPSSKTRQQKRKCVYDCTSPLFVGFLTFRSACALALSANEVQSHCRRLWLRCLKYDIKLIKGSNNCHLAFILIWLSSTCSSPYLTQRYRCGSDAAFESY